MALVISRRRMQKTIIQHKGETLEIQVVDMHESKVRLAFSAPKSFVIIRDNAKLHTEKTDEPG